MWFVGNTWPDGFRFPSGVIATMSASASGRTVSWSQVGGGVGRGTGVSVVTADVTAGVAVGVSTAAGVPPHATSATASTQGTRRIARG